jgi:hypothetical protein
MMLTTKNNAPLTAAEKKPNGIKGINAQGGA